MWPVLKYGDTILILHVRRVFKCVEVLVPYLLQCNGVTDHSMPQAVKSPAFQFREV